MTLFRTVPMIVAAMTAANKMSRLVVKGSTWVGRIGDSQPAILSHDLRGRGLW